MKTILFYSALFFCLSIPLNAQQVDPYQRVDSALVQRVNAAKEMQVSGTGLNQAEAILQDVIKLKPDYYRALYNLGLVYEALNQPGKAVDTLNQAKAIRDSQHIPDNSILNSLGWAYLNSGDLSSAENYFKQAYSVMEGNSREANEKILNNLGFLYLQEGKTVDARKYLMESKRKFNSAGADRILQLVSDYEQRQNASNNSGNLWMVYGLRTKKNGNWTERHFDLQGPDKTIVPNVNDRVVARDSVYIRSNLPIWDGNPDWVLAAILGYVKGGDAFNVLEVVDRNSARPQDDGNAWYWIRVSRPK